MDTNRNFRAQLPRYPLRQHLHPPPRRRHASVWTHHHPFPPVAPFSLHHPHSLHWPHSSRPTATAPPPPPSSLPRASPPLSAASAISPGLRFAGADPSPTALPFCLVALVAWCASLAPVRSVHAVRWGVKGIVNIKNLRVQNEILCVESSHYFEGGGGVSGQYARETTA